MNLLKGKTALITGGSRGIGAAIVKKFAAHGASCAFTFLEHAEAAETVRLEVTQRGSHDCTMYLCDGRKVNQVEKVFNAFIATFGRIDILINNAGIIRDRLLGGLEKKDWDAVMNTNLTAAYYWTKEVLPYMIGQRSGAIVNISSVAGITGNIGQANYAASKAGLIGLTQSVAKEVGRRNIRCNAIAPGIIETQMTAPLRRETGKELIKLIALHRFGTVEEVAEVALFLASDQSRYITGQVIRVCGGMYS